MQDLRLLLVQKVHSLSYVEGHAESLLHVQLDRLLLVKQIEKSSTEAVLCQNEHVTSLLIDRGAHEIDKVSVTHFDQCHNLAPELFRQVVFTQVLSIVLKLELLDGYIVLLIRRLENICTGARSNLLFEANVVNVDSEMILAHLELLCENTACLLSLCHLTRIEGYTRRFLGAIL